MVNVRVCENICFLSYRIQSSQYSTGWDVQWLFPLSSGMHKFIMHSQHVQLHVFLVLPAGLLALTFISSTTHTVLSSSAVITCPNQPRLPYWLVEAAVIPSDLTQPYLTHSMCSVNCTVDWLKLQYIIPWVCCPGQDIKEGKVRVWVKINVICENALCALGRICTC